MTPLLQAALNGDVGKASHSAVPVSTEELVADAVACVAAGARAVHLHPRDGDGRETVDGAIVDAVATAVREACGVPVGVTTGAWIEPDLRLRVAAVREWRVPDYASVNLSEAGAAEVMAALAEVGVGIEAGVWSVEDAIGLTDSGIEPHLTRVLVEPKESDPDAALQVASEIHRILDEAGSAAPRLQHGNGEATWPLLEDAVRRGLDTRIGFEDTLVLPSGERAAGNLELVAAARKLGAGR